jgi:8-oxo-dGTP pyrophosphatase MutT (NUDIX family)
VTKIPLRRVAARALPLDDHDRVLLLHGFDPARPEQRFWFTVGGAMEDGETPQEAAAREMYEEVAIQALAADFTGPYAARTVEFEWAQYAVIQDQSFFVIRVGDVAVSFEHMDQIEKDTTTAYRWWSAAEIEASDEVFHPADLAVILRKIGEESG